jgi:DNA topoisomerase IB
VGKYGKVILTLTDEFEKLQEEFILPMIAEPLLEIHDQKERQLEDMIDSEGEGYSKNVTAKMVFKNIK